MTYRNTSIRTPAYALLMLCIGLSACSKDEDTPTPAPPGGGGGGSSETPGAFPTFGDGDAALWAVRNFTVQETPLGDMEVEIGLGVAFFSNDQFASFINVGNVALNGADLTRQGNNVYVSVPSQQQPMGVDLSGEISWDVQGAGDFPAFSRDVDGFAFPSAGPVSSGTTVVRANGYTLTTGQVTGADSVVFMVGDVAKTLAGNATSCTFTQNELAGLTTGSSMVQIAPYKYQSEAIDGRTVYFGKEVVRSRSVVVE